MGPEIMIKIKNGKASIDVTGVEDATCADITRALESALGDVEEVQVKPEMYVELDSLEQYQYEDGE